MAIGHILKTRREELGLTQDEVAALTKISKPYLSAIEVGRTVNPPSERFLEQLEKALQFAPGQLIRMARLERTPAAIRDEMERLKAENRKFRSVLAGGGGPDELHNAEADDQPARKALDAGLLVPIINRLSAGYPAWSGDMDYPPGVADDYVRCPDLHDPHAFGAYVDGDSMEPKFHSGDIVVFSPAAEVKDGDDCFIRLADTHETNFKRVFPEPEGMIRLQPRNERYSPRILPREKIAGIYKAVLRVERLNAD